MFTVWARVTVQLHFYMFSTIYGVFSPQLSFFLHIPLFHRFKLIQRYIVVLTSANTAYDVIFALKLKLSTFLRSGLQVGSDRKCIFFIIPHHNQYATYFKAFSHINHACSWLHSMQRTKKYSVN